MRRQDEEGDAFFLPHSTAAPASEARRASAPAPGAQASQDRGEHRAIDIREQQQQQDEQGVEEEEAAGPQAWPEGLVQGER